MLLCSEVDLNTLVSPISPWGGCRFDDAMSRSIRSCLEGGKIKCLAGQLVLDFTVTTHVTGTRVTPQGCSQIFMADRLSTLILNMALTFEI